VGGDIREAEQSLGIVASLGHPLQKRILGTSIWGLTPGKALFDNQCFVGGMIAYLFLKKNFYRFADLLPSTFVA
jgi:hypothetical protein